MAIFAIGDLHLSFGTDKPMEVFGAHWEAHYDKIKLDWCERVTDDDVVIIPGDISWAITFEGAKIDLDWIESLPGKKILFKGNHDYWWVSKTKMDPCYKTITFVHNGYASYGNLAICGTRGWTCPGEEFTTEDEKVYKRELLRLENSITQAKRDGYTEILGVLHFPPTNEKKEPSGFTALFSKYEVKKVIYGHIHGKSNFRGALNGLYNGTEYILTSCDYLSFKLFTLEG